MSSVSPIEGLHALRLFNPKHDPYCKDEIRQLQRGGNGINGGYGNMTDELEFLPKRKESTEAPSGKGNDAPLLLTEPGRQGIEPIVGQNIIR